MSICLASGIEPVDFPSGVQVVGSGVLAGIRLAGVRGTVAGLRDA